MDTTVERDDPIAMMRDLVAGFLPEQADRVDAWADRVRAVDHQARILVRDHPVETVAAAVMLGFLFGRVLRG